MNEPFEIDGDWWLPEIPDIHITGKLIYKPGNILILILRDRLGRSPENDAFSSNTIDLEIIHGISSTGKLVTLYNCFQSHMNTLSNQNGIFYPSEYGVHSAFVGKQFPTTDGIQFTEIAVEFDNVNNWYNKQCLLFPPYEHGIIKIEFNSPNIINIPIKDLLVEIYVSPTHHSGLNNASVKTQTKFIITPHALKPFQYYLDLIRLIQNFLTLSMDRPTFETEVRGKTSEPLGVFNREDDVQIFYASSGWQSDTQETHFSKMLLPYLKIENDLPNMLKNWIEKSEIIKPVYDLYFASSYRQIYPENEFLNLTQAIETYHRRIFGGGFQEQKDYIINLYKAFIKVIPDDLDEEYKDSLVGGKLKFAYEYSLRKRLYLLSEHISKTYQINFLKDKQSQKDFGNFVVSVRNQFVHSLDEKEPIRGKELFELIQQLKFLLKICFFEQMELPLDISIGVLKNDWFGKRYLI